MAGLVVLGDGSTPVTTQQMRIWAETALTPEGWQHGVAIDIAPLGRIMQVRAGQPASGTRCSIVLPAPANLHSHAFQRAMAGLTETRGQASQDNFWSWRRLMYRFLEDLSPEEVEAIAAFAQVEMLEAGFASVGEFHYLHHARGGTPYENPAEMAVRLVSAAATSGIGLTLLPVLYQRGGCDDAPLSAGQDRFGCSRAQFSAVLDGAERVVRTLGADAVVGVAVHSLRAVGPDAMVWAERLRPSSPFHMHLAEQPAEVAEVVRVLHARPVSWVLENFSVDGRWCLIHCTQTDERETLALAAAGAVAGLCPITESNLGDGIFDGVRFLQAGGRFGIGSDSNVRISLVEELRTLEYSQRLRDGSRAALAVRHASSGRALFEATCSGGALAVGRAGGAIEPGAWADLLELDHSHTCLSGLRGDALLDAWIFAGGSAVARNVWSAGRHVVQDGRHVRREEVVDAARPVLKRLRSL